MALSLKCEKKSLNAIWYSLKVNLLKNENNFIEITLYILFQISSVDALRSPVMYQLKDLMGDPKKGRYYAKQLRAAPTPGVDFNFEV